MKDFHRNVVVLGSTGSIGKNTAIELAEHPDQFTVIGLAARNSITLLAEQAAMLHARYALTTDAARKVELAAALPSTCQAMAGEEAMIELVTRPEVDLVLCAIIGVTGIRPVLAALACGKTVALASKEVLCMAGELVMDASKRSSGLGIVPVDSEHSGLFQCLQGRRPDEIAKLWITASGGAFRDKTAEDLKHVTVADALRHPNWSMGPKVTIDSASLMNKALELVEAHFLFNVPEERLGAIMHIQSKLHAMVELTDGTFIAQISSPDMRMPIRYGLTYPQRFGGTSAKLNPLECWHLDFAPIDETRFPALPLARAAIHAGGTMPAIMNAANDIAVERFRNGELPFIKIWDVVEKTMNAFTAAPQQSVEQLEDMDKAARAFARNA